MHRVLDTLVLGKAPPGRGVRVAVLDTGLDATHPDFEGRVDWGASRSFSLIGQDLDDRARHGTHVAGIIAGTGAASSGYYRGVAPEAELVILKLSAGDRALSGNTIASIATAIEARVDIINYSNGHGPTLDAVRPPWIWSAELSALEEAFSEAAAAGILCVVAAGNRGPQPGTITQPGGLETVLTVGAIDQRKQVSQDSGRGPFRRCTQLRRGAVESYDPAQHLAGDVQTMRKPDVVAPGSVVAPRAHYLEVSEEALLLESELCDPHYVHMSGTSQATAVITGMAACLLELARSRKIELGPNPGLTLRKLFCAAASQLKSHNSHESGAGMVLWSNLQATLMDFHRSEDMRRSILQAEPRLKLE